MGTIKTGDKIRTPQEYELIKVRVEKGAVELEGKFLSTDPKIRSWVVVYEKLAVAMLHYEIEHDLLPI